MKLSIVTINYNNAEGLRKTMESVLAQTYTEIEYIIVDGASTDGSVDVIRELATRPTIKWVSEKDTGIYNAMNKGIRMATGDYIEILNSGDILFDANVTQRMIEHLDQINSQNENPIGILYGNMIKSWPNGKRMKEHAQPNIATTDSFLFFYRGTLNPDGTLFHSSLFEKYGFFNENMRICSDWEWFIRAVVFGNETPVHIDVDTILFDMTGISESGGKNRDIIQKERREYLESILPRSVLADYDKYSFPITQYQRLKKYHLWGFVHLIERITFKIEKCYNKLIHR